MESQSQTFKGVLINMCEKCVPFPMIKLQDIGDHYKHTDNMDQGSSKDDKALRKLVHLAVADMLRSHASEIPTPEQIKARVPIYVSSGSGKLQNKDEPAKIAEIPLYHCEGCWRFYSLPQDIRAGATKVDAKYNGGPMTDKQIWQLCVEKLRGFFYGSPITEANMYLFEEFLVMEPVKIEKEMGASAFRDIYGVSSNAN